ncbi:YdcH family protein [Pseudomonas sp. EL_65y_Pfl2_R95]|uniref:YdcH family protein n=1 Tax=Pseudomonas sp. EL_65y_Pfl2_R95 TaxID=3088698 RepID=UPI0030DAC7E8
MPLEHHSLKHEFPQHAAQFIALAQTNKRFARLVEEYEALDKRIYEIEDGHDSMDDLNLQGLKMQRVSLKDDISDLLSSKGD